MKQAALLLSILILGTHGYSRGALCFQDSTPSAVAQDARRSEETQTPAKVAPRRKSTSAAERASTERVPPARVLDVLRSVAKEAKDWNDAAASASMQAQIADMLWDDDEPSARAYLTQAWELAGKVEESQEVQASAFRNNSPRTNSRREVILVARNRAPELAKKWLEEMVQEEAAQKEKSNLRRGTFDDRTQRSTVLLQLALSSVEENPEAAADLAVESLQDGISFGLQNVLLKLQEKKFELAQRVFNAALTRLRTVGMLDANELLILYSFLYTPGMVSGANTTDNPSQSPLSKGRSQVTLKSAAEVNPALGLEFLKIAADLLVNAPLPATTENPLLSARTQISVINVLQERMAQQLPQQSMALQRRVQLIEADAQFVPTPQVERADFVAPLKGEDRQDYARRRVDRLEELARKETDPLRRDIAYVKAALATADEDYSRGVSIAGNIREDALRAHIADWLYSRASVHFAQADNLDRAYELLKKVNDPLQKSICLVVGAQKLAKAKDMPRAAQWLQETRAVIKSAEPNEALTLISFGVVSTYAQFDSAAALESLTDAVKLLNQSQMTKLGTGKAPVVRRFSGFANADYTYSTSGFGPNAAVAAFGQSWFENVLESLKKISNPELRAATILTLCRKNLKPTTPSNIR